MKVQCPYCGQEVAVNGFGRRPLNIDVTEVCGTLQRCHSVKAAAEELGCSRAYIYKVLKENGRSITDFVDPVKKRKPKGKHN